MNPAIDVHDVFRVHFAEPFAVVADLGYFAVEDFEDLLEIRLGIGVDLLARQRRARFGYARGIANHRGEIANQKDGGVAQILKMFQLAQHDGVAEVEIGGRGVHAEIHAQRLPGFQRFIKACLERFFGNNFRDAFFDVSELLFDEFEFVAGHLGCSFRALRHVL